MPPARLLNTREAAAFLRVSQASIRRWSDSGRLPAQRVGGRRERRFTEEDLGNLLTDQSRSAGPTEAPRPRAVAIQGLEIAPPCHLATYFDDDAGRVRLAVPFLAAGLQRGDACFLIAAGEHLAAYRVGLEEEGIDFDEALAMSRLKLAPAPGATWADAIRNWEKAWSGALNDGAPVIRVVGEMASELQVFRSIEEMLAYEEAYDRVSRRYPVVTLCQYDVRHFDGPSILRAARAHPDVLMKDFARILF
jgi:excisionase family DNA binding protein